MDAFKNYQNVLDTINQNAEQYNAKLENDTNIKNRTDEIVKTLGEAKVFISGKSLGQKVSKLVKPTVDKKLNEAGEYVKGKIQEGSDFLKEKLNQAVSGNAEEGGTGMTRMEALQDRLKTAQQARDNAAQQAESDRAAEARGAKDPEDNSAFDEGTELKPITSGEAVGGQEVPNPAFDPDSLEDGDLIAPSNPVSASGGITADSDPVFSSVMSQSRGQNLQNPFANARQNKFAPDQEDGQAQSTPRSAPAEPVEEVKAPEPGGGQNAPQENPDAVASDAKDIAEQDAKKVAIKETEEEGGEEAGAGILDAIPGLDVLGVIGGAIMAGIAAHKAKVAERNEEKKLQSTNIPIQTTFQSGVGTDMTG